MAKQAAKGRSKRIILNCLIVICVLVLAYSAYSLISYYISAKKSEDAYGKLRYVPPTNRPAAEAVDDYALRQAHYNELFGQNGDFVGWLRVYGMNIDYPVMQTPGEQDYYLHRDFSKEYSSSGCVFASAACDVNKPSDVVILYGHKMKNGSMFGRLSDLENEDFYKEHKYIQFDTLKERRSYLIVGMFKEAVDTGRPSEFRYYDYVDFAGQTDFDFFVSEAQKRQVFDTWESMKYGDKFLLLSTCEYSRTNGRLIVVAKQIANDQAPVFP